MNTEYPLLENVGLYRMFSLQMHSSFPLTHKQYSVFELQMHQLLKDSELIHMTREK